ncbi:transposase [Stenotrophomonas daejeonensis]|uniref:Transposase n=1 Tax=Stenotrophomonas daejeonensis TaxID=659018 RepID=A0A0R0DYP7_9GAMM|nr:transposase [Stenotrophomonas daejeonensis]KRG86773.1 transposase [Stenotrophomonas daejeonensis]
MDCLPRKGHHALRKGRSSLPGHIYHVTATTRSRAPRFADHRLAQAACRCFEDAAVLGDARLLTWVLMPDHAHWLVQLGQLRSLPGAIHALKAFSTRNIHRELGGCGSIWSRAYHDHALRRDEDVLTVARYIVANPLRARLVKRIGDYPYWNAIWL